MGHSLFDRESAAQCVAELRQLSRVAAGRCRIGVVGMRLDARTRGEAVLSLGRGARPAFVARARDAGLRALPRQG